MLFLGDHFFISFLETVMDLILMTWRRLLEV